MPLPLIPIALITILGLNGVSKTIEAKETMDNAKRVNRTSQEYAKEAEDFIAMAREKTSDAISAFGRVKIRILSESMNDFICTFEKIRHLNLSGFHESDEWGYLNPIEDSFQELKTASYDAQKIACNGLAAISSGALLAYGTYSTVMGGLGGLLVTATTGTTLSSLSGAAATKATLAWLGGGALKAGGLGIAGGSMVLGGLVVGPALAIGGSIFASQARTELNNAYSNYDKARTFRKQARNIGISLKGICVQAEQLTALLEALDLLFVAEIAEMKSIIQRSGTNGMLYIPEERKTICKCKQLAEIIKIILDTPLLKDDGTLSDTTETTLANGKKYLLSIGAI